MHSTLVRPQDHFYQSIPGLDHVVFKYRGFVPVVEGNPFDWKAYFEQGGHKVIVLDNYAGDRITSDGAIFPPAN